MFKAQDFEKAEIIYREIREKDPKNVDAINSLALCIKNRRNGDLSEVVGLYREALEIDQEDVEANFNMALIHLKGESGKNPEYRVAL